MDDPRELLREARDDVRCVLDAMEGAEDGVTTEIVEAQRSLLARIDAYLAAPQPEPVAEPEPVVRYCAGCGSIGDVDRDKYIDCCPDGRAMSVRIPERVAIQCRGTFQIAIAAPPAPAADARDAEEWLLARFGVVRGHPEWRALMEAFNAGRDAALRAEDGKR